MELIFVKVKVKAIPNSSTPLKETLEKAPS